MASTKALIRLAFLAAGAGVKGGMQWATPAQWYESNTPKCWMYNGRDKKWRDVSCCTEGVNGDTTGCY